MCNGKVKSQSISSLSLFQCFPRRVVHFVHFLFGRSVYFHCDNDSADNYEKMLQFIRNVIDL